MQKKLFIFLLIALFLLPVNAIAQRHKDHLGCGILDQTKLLNKKSSPEQRKLMENARQGMEKAAHDRTMKKELGVTRTLNITIPVVVHIVHGNGAENMSDSEIQYIMDWTNNDYIAGRVGGNCDGYGYLQANVGFNFQLAKKDPNGNPTTGIERHYEPTWTTNGTSYELDIKSRYQWTPSKYLNIYVVRSSDGGSGSAFAYYPHSVTGSNSVYDGIIISAWAMGRTAGYESILTHEIGHWANLIHTWGQNYYNGDPNACNDDDQVSDTPNTSGFTGTTCATQYTCGSWDNIENIMDYGTQPPTMFTLGQSARMEAALQSSTAGRNNLWSQQNLIDTGIVGSTNQSPIAVANGPYNGFTNSTVNFTSAGSYDPDGTIVSYRWDFGDGATSTAADPAHTYRNAGTFTVTLTVTDDLGATGSASTTAYIEGTTNTPPVANANGPYSGTGNTPVNFSSGGSYDPDGRIVSYEWNFGDGATSTAANPTHTYRSTGSYTVTLTVTDDQGATGSASTTADIGSAGGPVANINGPYSGSVNSPVSFSSSGSYSPNGAIVAYDWDFGDGATSTAANPSHTYNSAGTFTVTLTVTDETGATATASTTANITGGGGGYITSETEPNDSSSEANGPMGFGASVNGTLDSYYDMDWFYIDVTSPRTLDISGSLAGGSSANWLLYHESDTANYLAYPTSGFNGSYDATRTGRYYIQVYTWGGGGLTYNLTVR